MTTLAPVCLDELSSSIFRAGWLILRTSSQVWKREFLIFNFAGFLTQRVFKYADSESELIFYRIAVNIGANTGAQKNTGKRKVTSWLSWIAKNRLFLDQEIYLYFNFYSMSQVATTMRNGTCTCWTALRKSGARWFKFWVTNWQGGKICKTKSGPFLKNQRLVIHLTYENILDSYLLGKSMIPA